jgi:hypothetical protein
MARLVLEVLCVNVLKCCVWMYRSVLCGCVLGIEDDRPVEVTELATSIYSLWFGEE